MVLLGPEVAPEVSPRPRPPGLQPRGGRLVDGTYVLTGLRVFRASGQEAAFFRLLRVGMTARLTGGGGVWETLFATTAPNVGRLSEERTTDQVTALGETLRFVQTCPPEPGTTYSFTANGDHLLLFAQGDFDAVFVLTRQ